MRLKTLSNREKYRLLFMVGGRAMLQKPYKGEISAATLFGLYRTVIFTVQPAVGPTFRAVTKVVLPGNPAIGTYLAGATECA
ncbi:unnamed protein product [Heligmosomoides polygyrus]|uniref:Aldehyde dehydrogenase n=1 Tax=Heligmosomoides polygyrus TaxID=6339 RepID=A0A183GDN8_HELPZ|nr:unnamed protein product [Heligmosomoides polygyrus]